MLDPSRPMRPLTLLITCEHASALVPRQFRGLFAGRAAQAALESHRGSDLGARAVARELSKRLGCTYFEGRITRLLVDLNRTAAHPNLFSEFSRELPLGERQALIARYHRPHHAAVAAFVEKVSARRGQVLHLAVHSFTPVLRGERRRADLGLLYDPKRRPERTLCEGWQRTLDAAPFDLLVRRNYPYRGVADGVPTSMRKRFPEPSYVGIEIELNQGLLPSRQRQFVAALEQVVRRTEPTR